VTHESSIGITDEHSDLVVMTLLLNSPGTPWAADELGRELGDDVIALDAIARLHAAGLLDRGGDLVFASRSARRFSELVGGI
jgi:hypothetical protein